MNSNSSKSEASIDSDPKSFSYATALALNATSWHARRASRSQGCSGVQEPNSSGLRKDCDDCLLPGSWQLGRSCVVFCWLGRRGTQLAVDLWRSRCRCSFPNISLGSYIKPKGGFGLSPDPCNPQGSPMPCPHPQPYCRLQSTCSSLSCANLVSVVGWVTLHNSAVDLEVIIDIPIVSGRSSPLVRLHVLLILVM